MPLPQAPATERHTSHKPRIPFAYRPPFRFYFQNQPLVARHPREFPDSGNRMVLRPEPPPRGPISVPGAGRAMTLRRAALWCVAGSAALLGGAASAVALAVHRPALGRPWIQRALTPRGGDLLRMDHLRLELIPGRLFHGGPWVRHVEARGVVYERSRPRETEGPPDMTPLTPLFDIEDLSLTDARLRVVLPRGDLAVDGLRVRLAPGEGGIRAFTGTG